MGAAIVASDTPPVAEVMAHQVNGHLVPFFDVPLWVQAIVHLLDHPAERERLGRHARQTMVEKYDLHAVCLPQQLAWVHALLKP